MSTTAAPVDEGERYVKIAADGDCFYRAVADALVMCPTLDWLAPRRQMYNLPARFTVSTLRNLVADHLTAEHWMALQAAYQVDPREYSYLRRVTTLEKLRDRTRLCGEEVGTRMCVWADWSHIQLVVQLLGLVVLLRDSHQNFCLILKPDDLSHDCEQRRFVHVVRVDACHYNLFASGDQAILTDADVRASTIFDMFHNAPGGIDLWPEQH
eukprot:m.496691 g.496691  ORF g.496691 m.496691 type:complete len:211 (+) comp48404_c0_seq1:143-775(+)